MTRVLRGAWSRRGALLTLVAMTAVVVGGAVAVLRFAEAAGTPRTLAAPLLLLGAVAVPSIGAELATARREEVGLARLRGIHGLRLWRFLLVEPLLAILLGLLLGLGLGAAGALATTSAWLGEAADPLDRTALLTAAAIALAGLVIVGLGAAAALREPLAVQVATRRRPRRATTLAVFLSVLVLVGAAVAAYRAREASTDEPDLLVLLGPALLGLALGQVAIWLLRLLARGATGGTAGASGGGLAVFLASRRLARADDLVSPLRLVVAAAVVGALALTGSVAVSRWTDEQARIATAGPRVVDLDTGALGALALSRELDPEGEHLMAAVVVPNETRLAERRAFVDASRFPAVVGDFYDGTSAQAAAAAVDRLVPAGPAALSGPAQRLTVSGTALVKDGSAATSQAVTVRVDYVTDQSTAGSAQVRLDLPRQGARDEASVRVEDCTGTCQVNAIVVERVLPDSDFIPFDESAFEVLLDAVEFGDVELATAGWEPDPASVRASQDNRWSRGVSDFERVTLNRPDGLQVSPLSNTFLTLLPLAADEPLAVLAAGSGSPTALDLGGDERATAVVGEADVLPLVGAAGTLADLSAASVGSGPSVPSAEIRVVVGPHAPASLVDRLEEAAGAQVRGLGDVRRDLGEAAGAAQARAYALTALASALVALLALAAGVARHVRDYRRDVASLRVLGVGLGTARRAGRAELAGLTVLVLTGVAVGGWLAVELLLPGLPLVTVPPAALSPDLTSTWWPLAVPAALAALAVVLVGGRARAVRAGTTSPSMLREEEGR